MLKNVLHMTELFSYLLFEHCRVLLKIVAPAKSYLAAAELINFNKGEAISQNVGSSSNAPAKNNNTQIPKMPTPLKPPPGWEDAHDVFVILFLSKGADFNDFKFADVMNNTYNVANKLVFPPDAKLIRLYANQKIQNHKRRRKQSDLQALRTTSFEDRVARVYKFVIPNNFTKVLHPSSDTMSDSKEDVEGSYHNEGALVNTFGNFNLGSSQSPARNGARTSKSLTPPKTRAVSRPALIDGHRVLELVESVKKFENPCGLYVLLGKTPHVTDDRVEVSNYCQIFYLCQSPEELHSTSLKIVVDPTCMMWPSQYLQFTYRSVDASLTNDFHALQSQFDVYQELQNDGNKVFRSNLEERVSLMNSLIAAEGTSGEGKKKSVYLKLPNNLTCHNRCWQGETFVDRSLLEDGYLKKFCLNTDVGVPELDGWGIDTTLMTSAGDAGTRNWLTWYFAVSGGDGVRLANKSAKKGPSTLAELKQKAASKASGLAGI